VIFVVGQQNLNIEMTKIMIVNEHRNLIYLEFLKIGLNSVRNYHNSFPKYAEIEIDHLHNIPDYLNDRNEKRHLYYWDGERCLYIQRMGDFGFDKMENFKYVLNIYNNLWIKLGEMYAAQQGDAPEPASPAR
jgi:hypothetical protein